MGRSDDDQTVSFPTDQQILITRNFDAPKELVYRAWITPDLVRRWWPGERGTMTTAAIDLRVGGTWRYAMVLHDGLEVAFHGEYREVIPAERLVYTEVFSGQPAQRALTTVTFSEHAGRTTVAILITYLTRRERDSHGGFMSQGLREALHLLERAAASLHADGSTAESTPGTDTPTHG